MLSSTKKIGLDIADRSIAVVELSEKKTGLQITARARVALPSGIVERGRIKDQNKLTEALREVFAQASLDPFSGQDEIIFALPESQVYFHIFDLASHQSEERERLVQAEAISSIPIPVNNLVYAHAVLFSDKEKINILLVAANKEVLTEWGNFFQTIQLNVSDFYDIEPLALRRGLLAEPSARPICIVDMGAVTSSIDIFDNHGLRYTYSIMIAGDALTHEIAKTMKTSWEEAEALKERLGLVKENNNILPVLVKALEPLRDEMKTAFDYYKQNFGSSVSEVILAGGASQLKGLVDYFAVNLDVSVRLGEPIVKFSSRPKSAAKIARRSSKTKSSETDSVFYYIEAVGLARRAFPGWWEKSDPCLNLKITHDLSLPNSVVGKVERMIEKEEVIVERAAKRLWFHKGWLLIFAALCLIALGAVYGYRFYATNAPTSEVKSIRPNRDVSALVFPEKLENNAALGQNNGENTAGTPSNTGASSGSELTTAGTADNTAPAAQPPEGSTPTPEQKKALILDTPTGWLNVRSGPGTNYAVIIKVYPGESYPLLQEAEKWYKIQVDDKLEGWVTSQYASKQ